MIGKAIFARLGAVSAVTSLIATRVYAFPAPADVTRPYVTYQMISNPRERTIDGVTGLTRARMQLDCWAATPAEAEDVAAAVRQALEGFAGTAGGVTVKYARSEDEADTFNEPTDLQGKRLDFIFEYLD